MQGAALGTRCHLGLVSCHNRMSSETRARVVCAICPLSISFQSTSGEGCLKVGKQSYFGKHKTSCFHTHSAAHTSSAIRICQYFGETTKWPS